MASLTESLSSRFSVRYFFKKMRRKDTEKKPTWYQPLTYVHSCVHMLAHIHFSIYTCIHIYMDMHNPPHHLYMLIHIHEHAHIPYKHSYTLT